MSLVCVDSHQIEAQKVILAASPISSFCGSLNTHIHCTMHFPMSIDILEVHKCKNSLHAHFIVKSIHSFCRRCKTAQIFTKEKNIIFLIFFCDFFCGKCWRGGLRRVKFWSNLEKNICKRKVQNSFFLSAALHGEKNFWNNNHIFCCFYKGISRKN